MPVNKYLESLTKSLSTVVNVLVDHAFGKGTRFVLGIIVEEDADTFKCVMMGNMPPDMMKKWLKDTAVAMDEQDNIHVVTFQPEMEECNPDGETTH